MRELLNLCTGVFAFYLLFFAANMLDFIFDAIRSKIQGVERRKTHISDIIPFLPGLGSRYIPHFVLLLLIVLLGVLNEIGIVFFAKEEIGAFYEKREYTQNYEALIYPEEDEDPIFSIVQIEHNPGSFEERISDSYHIDHVWLPYRREYDVDSEYDPTSETPSISLDWDRYPIELMDVADEDSFIVLDTMKLKDEGGYIASKTGKVFHLKGCRYIKNIKPEHLIRLESEDRARVLGYEPCSICPF